MISLIHCDVDLYSDPAYQNALHSIENAHIKKYIGRKNALNVSMKNEIAYDLKSLAENPVNWNISNFDDEISILSVNNSCKSLWDVIDSFQLPTDTENMNIPSKLSYPYIDISQMNSLQGKEFEIYSRTMDFSGFFQNLETLRCRCISLRQQILQEESGEIEAFHLMPRDPSVEREIFNLYDMQEKKSNDNGNDNDNDNDNAISLSRVDEEIELGYSETERFMSALELKKQVQRLGWKHLTFDMIEKENSDWKFDQLTRPSSGNFANLYQLVEKSKNNISSIAEDFTISLDELNNITFSKNQSVVRKSLLDLKEKSNYLNLKKLKPLHVTLNVPKVDFYAESKYIILDYSAPRRKIPSRNDLFLSKLRLKQLVFNDSKLTSLPPNLFAKLEVKVLDTAAYKSLNFSDVLDGQVEFYNFLISMKTLDKEIIVESEDNLESCDTKQAEADEYENEGVEFVPSVTLPVREETVMPVSSSSKVTSKFPARGQFTVDIESEGFFKDFENRNSVIASEFESKTSAKVTAPREDISPKPFQRRSSPASVPASVPILGRSKKSESTHDKVKEYLKFLARSSKDLRDFGKAAEIYEAENITNIENMSPNLPLAPAPEVRAKTPVKSFFDKTLEESPVLGVRDVRTRETPKKRESEFEAVASKKHRYVTQQTFSVLFSENLIESFPKELLVELSNVHGIEVIDCFIASPISILVSPISGIILLDVTIFSEKSELKEVLRLMTAQVHKYRRLYVLLIGLNMKESRDIAQTKLLFFQSISRFPCEVISREVPANVSTLAKMIFTITEFESRQNLKIPQKCFEIFRNPSHQLSLNISFLQRFPTVNICLACVMLSCYNMDLGALFSSLDINTVLRELQADPSHPSSLSFLTNQLESFKFLSNTHVGFISAGTRSTSHVIDNAPNYSSGRSGNSNFSSSNNSNKISSYSTHANLASLD